jgi:hypothetical protein
METQRGKVDHGLLCVLNITVKGKHGTRGNPTSKECLSDPVLAIKVDKSQSHVVSLCIP